MFGRHDFALQFAKGQGGRFGCQKWQPNVTGANGSLLTTAIAEYAPLSLEAAFEADCQMANVVITVVFFPLLIILTD